MRISSNYIPHYWSSIKVSHRIINYLFSSEEANRAKTKEEMFLRVLLLIAVTSVCFGCAAVVESSLIEKRQTDDVEGTASPYIEILRGRDGRDGRDGEPGPQGLQGRDGKVGPQGDMGEQRPPGPSSGGVTYVRWGRTTCPNTTGTELVYKGKPAGSYYSQKGGTSDYLCLPEEPQYLAYGPGVHAHSPIHGVEYHTEDNQPLGHVLNHNVPYVICHSTLRESVLMIPACISCPDTWTLEHSGYLMTEYKCKKHFIKMLKDVGMVVPKIKGTRL